MGRLRAVGAATFLAAAAFAGCGDDRESDEGSGGTAGQAPDTSGREALGDAGDAHASAGSGTNSTGGAAGRTAGDGNTDDGGNAGARFVSGGASGNGTDDAGAGGEFFDSAGAGGEGACTGKTCEELRACGGSVDDGCGRVLQCPPCDACVLAAGPFHARRARSAGFSGTVELYSELYDVSCQSVDDCVAACLERGGSTAMCEASECVEGLPNESSHCLPATTWRNLEALQAEGQDPARDGATLTLVNNPYRDRLIADDFRFSIPDDATITGITVHVRRAADRLDVAVDDSVRLTSADGIRATDRSSPLKWSTELQEITYGGPTDLWGEPWSPADVNSPDFGVALSVAYTQTAGNGRAYVDIVYATVHYRAPCP